jgi:hypothetical protein
MVTMSQSRTKCRAPDVERITVRCPSRGDVDVSDILGGRGDLSGYCRLAVAAGATSERKSRRHTDPDPDPAAATTSLSCH